MRLGDFAEVLGRRPKLPVKSIGPQETQAYFGRLALFAELDLSASCEQTLGWQPTGPTVRADLESLQVHKG